MLLPLVQQLNISSDSIAHIMDIATFDAWFAVIIASIIVTIATKVARARAISEKHRIRRELLLWSSTCYPH
jgi:hypothetical protein